MVQTNPLGFAAVDDGRSDLLLDGRRCKQSITPPVGFLLCDLEEVPPENGWLTAAERDWLTGRRSPKRISDWRLGRWTAKRAIEAFLQCHEESLPTAIEVFAADDGVPTAFADGRPLSLTLSLSHTDGRALCVVGEDGITLGCDLESIERRSPAFVETYFTTAEATAVAAIIGTDRDLLVNLIWSAKESCLKALRCGLREDTRSVEVAVSPQKNTDWGSLVVTSERHDLSFGGLWRQIGGLVVTLVSRPAPDNLINLN